MALIGARGAPLVTSGAMFTTAASNSANGWATDSLAPPTLLTTSLRCTAPVVVAATSADRAGGTVNLVVPPAAAVGDLLIAHVVNDNGSTPPSGWSLLNQVTAGGNLQSTLYQLIASSGDLNTTYSFAVSGTKASGSMVVVRNAVGLVAADHAIGLANGSTSSITAPSVSSTVSNSLLVAFFGLKSGGRAFSTPAGMTETYDFGGANTSLAADYELQAAAGASGARTSTASASAGSIGQSVAISPMDVPEVDLSWTPTSSTWATGHEITRNAIVVASVTPRMTATWTDTAPTSGSNTYEVRSVVGNWRSPAVASTLTVGCS